MSKTILITGNGTGYGNLIAKALSEEGHGVIAAVDVTDTKERRASDELRSMPNIEVVNIDLTSEKSIAENIGHIVHKYGSIDLLINDVKVAGMGLLEATSVSQIEHTFQIGLFNVIRMIKAVLPDMRKNKAGIILNICCGPALFSLPFFIPQTMSKMSIIALSEGLKTELKHEGVDCLSVLVDSCLSESFNDKLLGADIPEIARKYQFESRKMENKLKRSVYELTPTNENRQRLTNEIIDILNIKRVRRRGQIVIDKYDDSDINALLAQRNQLKNRWLERIGIEL